MRKAVLSIQHLLAMFGATVLVPLLTGLDPSVAIFCAGIGTLIFHKCTDLKVPVFLGSSFAFISVINQVKNTFNGDLSYAQGSIMVSGLLYIIMSMIIKKVFSTTSNWGNDNDYRFKLITNCSGNGNE